MNCPDPATAYAALHTPDGAELLAINLDGARRAVCRLREALIREGGQ